ncbi:MAG: glycosyltransferase, partial [Candidatus Edwardsbacteria bacterium]|nr:glycosyltransferase [Candidatus Edwardsbacteria bacterium]
QALETRVIKNSDLVLGVNQAIVDELKAKNPNIDRSRFYLLSHGYDPEDFRSEVAPDPDHFTIVHTGTFINNRGPAVLLGALRHIRAASPEVGDRVRVIFAGAHRAEDLKAVQEAGLGDAVTFTGYVPHTESVRLLKRAAALWLVMGREETANVTPGKLFEYLGAKKPILASIPADGAAAKIILETGAGQVLAPNDERGLAAAIGDLVRRWQTGEPLYFGDSMAVAQYDRRLIARKLAEMLDSLTLRSQ